MEGANTLYRGSARLSSAFTTLEHREHIGTQNAQALECKVRIPVQARRARIDEVGNAATTVRNPRDKISFHIGHPELYLPAVWRKDGWFRQDFQMPGSLRERLARRMGVDPRGLLIRNHSLKIQRYGPAEYKMTSSSGVSFEHCHLPWVQRPRRSPAADSSSASPTSIFHRASTSAHSIFGLLPVLNLHRRRSPASARNSQLLHAEVQS